MLAVGASGGVTVPDFDVPEMIISLIAASPPVSLSSRLLPSIVLVSDAVTLK